VEALLRTFGESTVSAFALAPDTDYHFSTNGKAVIAYRFESNVLLGIGDPVGPKEDLPALLHSFAQYCREHDWDFAFFQARPEFLPLYGVQGWRSIHVGEDPILVPERFSLEGSAMGDVRRAARKLEEAGWTARSYLPATNPLDLAREHEGVSEQLRAISADWLRSRYGGEKGFCMGRFDPAWLRSSWVEVAWDAEHRRASAFLTWVPIPARRGWALDLTRRRADAPNGVMDFLVVKSVESARARGDAMLSLSLSALADVHDSTPPEPPEKSRSFLKSHLARFYDFEGLFRWKKKFALEFEDRYLVYPDPLALPRVVLALVRAQSPGGLRSYLRPPAPARPPAA
jgi:phosphatidylglycerol lysyltransferase